MLDSRLIGIASADDLERLPTTVELPTDWKVDSERLLPLPSCFDDMRHDTRYKYHARAMLLAEASLPHVARQSGRHVVFIKDVSRAGIAFYHEEQLYPRERMQLWLPGQELHIVRISRCRKVNDRCYEIGARFD